MIAVLACLTLIAVAAGDGLAADTWTWLDVAAEKPIEHAVMVRGPFDDAHRKTRLTGPVAMAATAADAGTCFTVYATAVPGDEPPRTAVVGGVPLRLGAPAFLLVPARRLRDGEPATDPPPGVYEARPVLEPPPAIDGGPDAAGPPAYLCLAVDYRHHFDRVPVTDAEQGLVVFAGGDRSAGGARTAAADDLGIATLAARGTARVAVWLPVRPVQEGDRPGVRP